MGKSDNSQMKINSSETSNSRQKRPCKRLVSYAKLINGQTKKKKKTVIPEKIIGATETNNGTLMFMLKYKDKEDGELISHAVAIKKYPQLLIAFYQSNLIIKN